MKSKLLYFILLLCLAGCKISNTDKAEVNCVYTFDSLLNQNRSVKFTTDTVLEGFDVLDPANFVGERGFYKFDRSGRLKEYYYLLNEKDEAFYGTKFDTLGNITERTLNGAVRWFLKKRGEDSIRIACYLFALHNEFTGAQLIMGNEIKEVTIRKQEHISNLVGFAVTIKKNKGLQKIYFEAEEKITLLT
jgi:hypothetical protein